MKVRAPNGAEWRTGRRWLAWRPRMPAPLSFLLGIVESIGLFDVLFPLAVIVLILALPLAVVHLLNWAVALVATPIALALRAWAGQSWAVVAYPYRYAYRHGEHVGTASGFAAAGDLASQARAAIESTGQPLPLTGPPPPPRRPLEERTRVERWVLRHTSQHLPPDPYGPDRQPAGRPDPNRMT
jgi:hypothetical protein